MKNISLGLLSLFVIVTPVLPAPSQDDGGLIGHWKLDEHGPGNLVADSTPNQWHGTCGTALAECSGDGKLGRAIRFPEARTINLDRHAAALGKLTDFTLSLWIRPDSPRAASQMLFMLSDGTTGHRMQMEVHQGRLHFGWQNGGSFTGFDTGELAWTPGTWYHVVFVNDHKAGKTILRSNDLVYKSNADRLSPADLQSTVKRAAIGSLHDTYVFHGCVDDVRLYNRALSLPEQLAIYDAAGGAPDDARRAAAKAALLEQHRRKQADDQVRQLFLEREAPRLSTSELQQKSEWLFQAEGEDLLARTDKEIVWTREIIERRQKRTEVSNLAGEAEELKKIEQAASAAAATPDASRQLALYFQVRALKRRVMLKFAGDRFFEHPLRRCPVHAPQPGHARHQAPDRMGPRKPIPQRNVRHPRCEAAGAGGFFPPPGAAASRPAGRFWSGGGHVQFRPFVRRPPCSVLHEAGERESLPSLRNRAGRKALPADHPRRLFRHRPDLSAGWPRRCSSPRGPRCMPSAECGRAVTF